MSQNLAFSITIPDGQIIQFTKEATFENFIGQFQPFCPKLLCVVDGTSLQYYDKKAALPTNIRFDYKQRRGLLTEYYFRNIGDDTLYCVFGREAAKLFYPRIDEVDPNGINEPSSVSHIQDSPLVKSVHLDSKLNDPSLLNDNSHPNNMLETHINDPFLINIHPNLKVNEIQQSLSIVSKSQRLPIIQPIKSSSIPLFHETPNISPIYNSNMGVEKNISEKIRKDIGSNQIVIIDQGIRLSFPDPNYPIEIKAYHP